ncbi:MAG: HAMP domain-containing histidine kinase [Chloroflexi bacterium]|nr:MAG: HAMP domain-containing histidine kinase [Chloroflexota bacterium]TME17668.1 MAG: HAMP domain-containing histidine kinase [Chloroflexota bacterium]
MSLRFRLLIAAAGIVVVSLVLSGALTWVLVRNLEFDDAHLQLDRLALLRRAEVLRAECLTIPSGTTTTCPGGNGRLASRAAYEDRLRNLAVASGADRMLLVAANRTIVFDSAGSDSIGTKIVLGAQRKIDQGTVNEGNVVISGQDFIGAGVAIAPRRDPDGAAGLVFARTVASINSLATGQVVPRLLGAGLAALLLALAIALLLSRAFARPLSELAGAAEEIAAGNYAARVGVTGRDEIGVVGRSFNRMAEAVERARATQRDFLANVSHELKTPLTSLLGFSQALIDGSLQTPAERTRAGTIIHEEAHRVLRMSQELLDLARVESGQISLHPTDVDLKALLEQEIEIVKPRAGERQLALDLRLPTSPPHVKSDPERLHQIIDNLLDNAVKYAPAGTPVEVAVANGLMNVEVAVSNQVDQNPPDPQRIFDRFYRGDPSRSSAAGGVGLGLAISRELAVALGGKLWAELDGQVLRVRLNLPSI